MPNQLNLPIDPDTNSADAVRDAEREEYLARLREYLKDPAFRAIEGFPIGEDEDILALSDPPWYTACPNPFLPEIIEQWRKERDEIREELGLPTGDDEGYHREPYASDVSEGKTDPVYKAHSYHTKVPHKAIMRYILHYTDPGDVVMDTFCGSGMTGVAAQLCGDKAAVQDLGYRVDNDGVVWNGDEWFSRLGARKTALNDLSPAATFIAYNYNTPVDAREFQRETRRVLRSMTQSAAAMYETWHPHCDAPERVLGRIDYTVWSEVFHCPECASEIEYLAQSLDIETGRIAKEFPCPACSTLLKKRDLVRIYESEFDSVLGKTTRVPKRIPFLIRYRLGRSKYDKRPDRHDLEVIEELASKPIADGVPTDELPFMHMTHQRASMSAQGVTHLHHFFFPRARQVLGYLWGYAMSLRDRRLRSMLLFTIEQAIWTMSIMDAYRPTGFSQVSQYMKGIYYVPSQISEVSPWYVLGGKIKRLLRLFPSLHMSQQNTVITTQSSTDLGSSAPSVDYIFTDPPFGENIYYADLNYVVESWHRVWTQSDPEAIIDRAKKKTLRDYQRLMRQSFVSYYSRLRPGRWMTVEFHNSHNSVWNAIQEAMQSAGFVVADVRTLDKKAGSYRQVTASSAAKQDLVISAYKPTDEAESVFRTQAGTPEGAWAFVRQHLAQVPVVAQEGGIIESIAERQDYLLYDRMVAYHLTRNATVPLSASQFYAGLRERFVLRDGMFFLPDQVTEYDRARMAGAEVQQLSLFVNDEKSAIQWLRLRLDPETGGTPQTYQDIQPAFLQELHQASHEALPELRSLLERNFVKDDRDRYHVPDATKAGDIEQLRKKELLREFEEYAAGKGRLRQFRSEAVRAGFAACHAAREWQKLIHVARRLPSQVLEEDPDLLMYYDSASLMTD